MTGSEWPFYVSYSWATEAQHPLVEKLQKDAIHFPRIKLVHDTEKCKPGDSIKAFLQQVGQAPRLILILSEEYFRSEYTLKEFAIALKHGGLNTRVRVVLVDGFRVDHFLRDNKNELQCDLNRFDINLEDFQEELELLGDSLVSISNADKNTDFSPVLQSIQESYQQYPNPEVEDPEKLINVRSTALVPLRHQIENAVR